MIPGALAAAALLAARVAAAPGADPDGRSCTPPVLAQPPDGAVFPATATYARVSWRPLHPPYDVEVRAQAANAGQNEERGKPNLAAARLSGTYFYVPIEPGHRYSWRLRSARDAESCVPRARSFSVRGRPGRPPPPDTLASWVRETRRLAPVAELLEMELRVMAAEYLRADTAEHAALLRRGQGLSENFVWYITRLEAQRKTDTRAALVSGYLRFLPCAKTAGCSTGAVLSHIEEGSAERRDLEVLVGRLWSASVEYDTAGKRYVERVEAANLEQESRAHRADLARGAGALLAAGTLSALLYRRRCDTTRRATRGAGAPCALPAGRTAPVAAPECGVESPRAAEEPLPRGRVLGPGYRIEKLLGRGNSGMTFAAVELARERPVAVKRVRGDLLRRERDIERFLTQARAAARLQHPRVAETLAVFLENERVYVAAELVPGRSLQEALRDHGPLSLDSIRNVLSQAADALDAAHAAGILHGGLNPQNLRLRPDGTVKLTDFSLALAARRIGSASGWAWPGSLGYLAPEAEIGENSSRSDIFSLGALLYEMAAGSPPFAGAELERKRGRRFTPVQRADLPPGFASVIDKALEPDPARRFPSASELYAAVLETR